VSAWLEADQDEEAAADDAAERAAGRPADVLARLRCRAGRDATGQVKRYRGAAGRKADSEGPLTRPHRPPLNDDLVAYVSRRLTDRDRRILELLAEHRVFTTDQLADAFFGSPTTARHRLTQLHQLRLVQRFAPFVPKGSAPFHYVLDQLGDLVVAADRGEERKGRWRQDRALVLSRSQRLAHIVGVNGFFTALMGQTRRQPECRLVQWWSEQRCQDWCGALVRPDGYGAWREDEGLVEFLLEYDRGTEPLERLHQKLDGYGWLADAVERHTPVLFVLPSARREITVRAALADAGIPVATAVAPSSPSAPVWLPLGAEGRRRLVDLAGLPGRNFRDFDWSIHAWPPRFHYQEVAPWVTRAS
jgi:DNA-binding CsgD family transcriptional regulator